MISVLDRGRSGNPAWRGALFYLAFWSVLAVYEPFLNVHFAHLGLSGREIGILAALTPLAVLVEAPVVSALADGRARRVVTLALLLGGYAVVLLLLGLPRTFVALLPFMALLAIFRGPILPIADSLVVRMAQRHQLNYGGLRLWGSLGFAIMAVVCGLLWDRAGFDWMFAAAGLLLLPVVLLALFLEEGARVERETHRSIREISRDRGLVAILMASYLAQAGILVSFVFGGVFMDELARANSQVLVGLLFAVLALAELPAMLGAARTMAWLGGPGTLLLAYGLSGLGLLGFALAGTPALLLAAAVVRGMGFGLFYVCTVQLLDRRVSDEWSATVQALFNAGAVGLAPLLINPLAGEIYDRLGAAAVFGLATGLVMLAALVVSLAAARGLLSAEVRPLAQGSGGR